MNFPIKQAILNRRKHTADLLKKRGFKEYLYKNLLILKNIKRSIDFTKMRC